MDTSTPRAASRPRPVPDADSAPYWDACAEHRMTVQECTDCGQRRFPPVGMCHRCNGWDFTWTEVHDGVVDSWVVVHQSPIAAFAAEVPYVAAVVDIADGVRVPTQLVGIAPDQVRRGLPVEVTWLDVDDGFALPLFTPTTS